MITRDIVYHPTKMKTSKSHQLNISSDDQTLEKDRKQNPIEESDQNISTMNDIDKIFYESDAIVMRKQNELNKLKKKKQKKKMKWWKKTLICFSIIFVIFVSAVGGLLYYISHVVYPEIKISFLKQYETMQQNVSQMDDNTLTLEQQYQKKLILVFDVNDINEMIDKIEDIKALEKLINLNENADLSLLPENKKEEFNAIYQEYIELKEQTQQSTEASQ